MKQPHEQRHTDEIVHMQAEFPTSGTPLNPIEESWVLFDKKSPSVDQPGSTE
ncbi:hypothetical protein [Brevibacillus sp. NRS-1366]|uniref:hypothetical protein n=1 Tax=Brevibacillus sp. NRS-1366 TaxID=3233899 RepID=UPI003D23422C